MRLLNWKTMLSLGAIFVLSVCLITLSFDHYEVKDKMLNSPVYKKMLSKITRVEQVEILVYPDLKPENPQVKLLSAYIRHRNSQLSREITRLIAEGMVKAAEENNVPLPLLAGLVEKESVFNPMASAVIPGGKGERARGLTQIYRGEGIEIDVDKAYDIGYNLDTGCRILNKKIDLNHGNMENALANYSGNAVGYSTSVLENVGRFTIYSIKAKSKAEVAINFQQ